MYVSLQLQDDINSKGFKVLHEYIDNYEKLSLGMVAVYDHSINIDFVIATKLSGLKNELNRIEQMYMTQKAKNVEFLSAIENVS